MARATDAEVVVGDQGRQDRDSFRTSRTPSTRAIRLRFLFLRGAVTLPAAAPLPSMRASTSSKSSPAGTRGRLDPAGRERASAIWAAAGCTIDSRTTRHATADLDDMTIPSKLEQAGRGAGTISIAKAGATATVENARVSRPAPKSVTYPWPGWPPKGQINPAHPRPSSHRTMGESRPIRTVVSPAAFEAAAVQVG